MLPCVFHVCVGTIIHALGGGKVNWTELTDLAFVTFVETQNGRSRAGLNHRRQEQSHLSAPITSRSFLRPQPRVTSRKCFKWGKTREIVWRLQKCPQTHPPRPSFSSSHLPQHLLPEQSESSTFQLMRWEAPNHRWGLAPAWARLSPASSILTLLHLLPWQHWHVPMLRSALTLNIA